MAGTFAYSQGSAGTSSIARDALLTNLAQTLQNNGWTILQTCEDYGFFTRLKIDVSPFPAGSPFFHAVSVNGGFSGRFFIPDQGSFDAFNPPDNYDKECLNSFNSSVAAAAVLGYIAANAIGAKWVPGASVILEDTPDKEVKAIQYASSNTSQPFHVLENLPDSLYPNLQIGAGLRCSWGGPHGGGYLLKSAPLGDLDNFLYLYIMDAARPPKETNMTAWFTDPGVGQSIPLQQRTNLASEVYALGGLVGTYDYFMSPNNFWFTNNDLQLFGTRPYSYLSSLLPAGLNAKVASFAAGFISPAGFRIGKNLYAGWVQTDEGVNQNGYNLFVPYIRKWENTDNERKQWKYNLGPFGVACEAHEAFLLYGYTGNSEGFRLLGLLKDMIIVNDKYSSIGPFFHSGQWWEPYSQTSDFDFNTLCVASRIAG